MTHEINKAKLLGSLLLFTRVFYELRTGREFSMVIPIGRESHAITICRALVKCFRLETTHLMINIPPGLFKSTLLKYFVAWCFAHYPDCQFLYITFSHELATEHTYDIKEIMSLKEYKDMFDIHIKRDSSAKDNFKTEAGGAVKAFGSLGAVTGHNAGLPIVDRFSGANLLDDLHKPDEVHSDTIRPKVFRNYNETIKQRIRSPVVPSIYIGQRLHEDDTPACLLEGKDGYDWERIILPGRDVVGNSIHPILYPIAKLDTEEKFNNYVYCSQIQQNPIPAGGGLFKSIYFDKLDIEPEILCTFIIGDTAETDKTYNDATVFSFFGIYKIKEVGHDIEQYGLHWLDCWEEWVEPKDLNTLFLDFYTSCMRYKVKPCVSAIEKKSTGVSLVSYLSTFRGMQLINIERSPGKSKTQRFIECQPYIARRLITLPSKGRHTQKCIDHMSKITANNSHRNDDIADTLADGIRMALIDKSITFAGAYDDNNSKILEQLVYHTQRYDRARQGLFGN